MPHFQASNQLREKPWGRGCRGGYIMNHLSQRSVNFHCSGRSETILNL